MKTIMYYIKYLLEFVRTFPQIIISINFIDIYPFWLVYCPDAINWDVKEINVEDSTKMTLK